MQLMLELPIASPEKRIQFTEGLLLTGSCFTEHIGKTLGEMKFQVLQNPHGILFDPLSVASSLVSYVHNKQYGKEDLFFYEELWQSWQHHSLFSNTSQQDCLDRINFSQRQAHEFLQKAGWCVITLGSAFSYRLGAQAPSIHLSAAGPGREVANCHRAPGNWFRKELMETSAICSALEEALQALFQFNKNVQVIFTVSPVRHIRDGLVDNNRSKARLIESVHRLKEAFGRVHYFPAYELVIDVLRDYRFYDIDLVHPNYQATSYVLEQFREHYIDKPSREMMSELSRILSARKHRAFQPDTGAHRNFLETHMLLAKAFQQKYPSIDMGEEIRYFSETTP